MENRFFSGDAAPFDSDDTDTAAQQRQDLQTLSQAQRRLEGPDAGTDTREDQQDGGDAKELKEADEEYKVSFEGASSCGSGRGCMGSSYCAGPGTIGSSCGSGRGCMGSNYCSSYS